MTTTVWEQADPIQGQFADGTVIIEGEAAPDEEAAFPNLCSMVLIGDGTVACPYFPPANRPENHLLVRLRRTFPEQQFLVRNVAAEGATVAGDLRSGRIAQIFAAIPEAHLAFVRYNLREGDQDGFGEYLEGLKVLCGALRQQYAGITVVLETGIWVHHPAHFVGDSHARLGPLYDTMRGWAIEAGYPVVDVYQKMQAEGTKGNWDLRVRGLPTPEQTVVDNSFDEFFGDEPAFFANIHPNSRCLAMIADWEVAMLKQLARKG